MSLKNIVVRMDIICGLRNIRTANIVASDHCDLGPVFLGKEGKAYDG